MRHEHVSFVIRCVVTWAIPKSTFLELSPDSIISVSFFFLSFFLLHDLIMVTVSLCETSHAFSFTTPSIQRVHSVQAHLLISCPSNFQDSLLFLFCFHSCFLHIHAVGLPLFHYVLQLSL